MARSEKGEDGGNSSSSSESSAMSAEANIFASMKERDVIYTGPLGIDLQRRVGENE